MGWESALGLLSCAVCIVYKYMSSGMWRWAELEEIGTVHVDKTKSRWHMRSASRHQLTVPRVRCSTYGCRCFASAGPTVTAWQSAQFSCWARPFSTDSENPPVCLLLAFRWQLDSALGVFFYVFALYKCTFIYLLTYKYDIEEYI